MGCDPNEESVPSYWLSLITLFVGSFIGVYHIVSLNVSLPGFIQIFHSELGTVQWLITGFTLATGIIAPISGYALGCYWCCSSRSGIVEVQPIESGHYFNLCSWMDVYPIYWNRLIHDTCYERRTQVWRWFREAYQDMQQPSSTGCVKFREL